MDPTGADRKLPSLELAIVVVGTILVLVVGILTGASRALDHLIESNSPNHGLADIGPALLFLSCGLGVLAARRWRDSDIERVRLATAQSELTDSEERYRLIVELSPSPIVVYDLDRTVVFVNRATVELLHAHRAADLIGLNVSRFIDASSQGDAVRGREQLERDGMNPFHAMRLRRLDGSTVETQVATSRTTFAGADAVQAVIQDVTMLKDTADTLKRAADDMISAMARLAETRDPYTSGHQARVAAMGERIARQMGLPPVTCETVRLAGMVHDLGKMSIPAEILTKPGRLTDAEFELIKTHAQRGYELLAPIDFPWPIAEIVREHHERLDGSGYPRGIEDGDIRIEARVLAVADVVEAVSSDRPYRPALGLERALSIISEGRGTLFDEGCVDACLALAESGELTGCDTPECTLRGAAYTAA